MSNPLRIEGERCDHTRVVLDQEDRSVHCSKCGLVIDAFEILLRESEKNARQEGFLVKARGETARLYGDIENQRKTLRRLRKSADNENRKLNRLIAARKEAEAEAEEENARGSPSQGEFQLGAAASAALQRFQS